MSSNWYEVLKGEGQIPAVLVQILDGSDLDPRKLGENVASALNGRSVLHQNIGQGRQSMHYERLPGGLALRFRDPVSGGVTEPKAFLIVCEGFSPDILEPLVGRDASFMKEVQPAAVQGRGGGLTRHTPSL